MFSDVRRWWSCWHVKKWFTNFLEKNNGVREVRGYKVKLNKYGLKRCDLFLIGHGKPLRVSDLCLRRSTAEEFSNVAEFRSRVGFPRGNPMILGWGFWNVTLSSETRLVELLVIKRKTLNSLLQEGDFQALLLITQNTINRISVGRVTHGFWDQRLELKICLWFLEGKLLV